MYTHINVPATVLERLKSEEPGRDEMDLDAKNQFYRFCRIQTIFLHFQRIHHSDPSV